MHPQNSTHSRHNARAWRVILLGGASGVGKTSVSYRLAQRYGEWLRQEAERLGVAAVPTRPWDTVLERVIATIDATMDACISTQARSTMHTD